MPDEKIPVEFSYNFSKGNFIKSVYYETETDRAILVFKDNLGTYQLWIPKSIIKYDWNRDKQKPQNIYVKWVPPDFNWQKKEAKHN